MMISSAKILHFISLVLWITTINGKAVPAPSTSLSKGCDKTCQTECLEVLNKYRANHDAPKLKFSRELANKAQEWADGGKFGYDMDARGKYGQLIEWDVKDELPTFTSVIKRWHDKEKDFDFIAGKSKNGDTLHDFTQVVWKKAHEAGCGKGKLFGSRYYVVWMDADGVLSPNSTDEGKNVGPPKQDDDHWYEITMIKAVGEPLYWNATNATKPSIGQPNIRVKTSIPADEEDLNSVESEANVLNDANNIKKYVHDSLSSVLAEENREVSQLRDEFEGLDDVPNVRFGGGPSQDLYDGLPEENIYDGKETGTKLMKQAAETTKWNKGIKQLPFTGRKFQKYPLRHQDNPTKNLQKEPLKVQNNPFEKMNSPQQRKIPMEKLPETIDAGQTKLSESSPTTVIHEELNISDKNTAVKPTSSKPKQIKNKLSAGKRHGSELADTSQDGGQEMAGMIMGKLPDNVPGNDGSQDQSSNDKVLKIASDENLSPDQENELSKVSKFINTRLKVLNKQKEFQGTPGKELKNGYSAKEQGNSEELMNGKTDDEPDARPARITMVGAPLSFPENNNKDVVKDIHDKVTALWDAHLKSKKEKAKKAKALGEDDLSAHLYQDGFDDSPQGEGSSFSANDAFHDSGDLQGHQYTAGNHHQEIYPDNYDHNLMSGPHPNGMHSNPGNSFHGFIPPIRLHPGGDWLGGPMAPPVPPVSPAFDDPITHAMNSGPGGLYEYRKKYTSEEPEKDTERFLHRKKNSLQSVVDVYEDKEDLPESANSDNEREPVLQPIKLPKKQALVGSEKPSFKDTARKPQDHKDLLALPKELTARPDNEMTMESQLPDLLSDTPSTSMTNSEETDHPGYFNEEPGLNSPTFVDQRNNQYQRHPTSNNNPHLHYTQPLNSPVMRSQAGYPAYPYGYRQPYQYNPMQTVGLPQGYGYGQQQEPIQSVQDMTYNQGYNYPQQSQVQEPVTSMPSMPQVTGTSNGNTPRPTQPQKILKGVSLPSSMGVVTDNEAQQSALTLSDKNDKSPKKPSGTKEVENVPLTPSSSEEEHPDETKDEGEETDSEEGTTTPPQNSPQQGQGEVSGPEGGASGMPQSQTQNSVPQGGSLNGATITVDGKPVKGPYKSSGDYTVKGPFVYQTDTTIIMGGPQNSGDSTTIPMNGGDSPSQVPNSNPQNVPPTVDNTSGQQHKQNSEEADKGGNQFQPELLKRPSLITLLKEAEMNKQKETKGKSDENKESEKEESNSSEEQPESSRESEKRPSEEGENEKSSKAPSEAEKEGSTEKENQPSGAVEGQKEQQGPSDKAKPGKSSQSKEQPVESSQEGSAGSSEEKEQQKGSQAKEESNNQMKIETEPNGPEGNENTQESNESEKQPSGPTSNENPPSGSSENEKPESNLSENENPPSGSLKNEKTESGSSENKKQPSGSSENEKQSTSSSENEKQPSGSSENEKQSTSSSENEKQPSGSSENEKQSTSSSENEKQPSSSSENEKQSTSSSENEKQPSGSIDPSGSAENENRPSGSTGPSRSSDNQKSPSGSSENEKSPSGSIDPTTGSADKEKPQTGPSENENQSTGSMNSSGQPNSEKNPSGSVENGKQQSGSIDPSGPTGGGKQTSESDNENLSSGSSENRKPIGSIDPSKSKGNKDESNGNEPTKSKEIEEQTQNHQQQSIFLTNPEIFKDQSQTNEGGEGVSIYKKPSFDLPKGAHYEPAIEAQHPSNSHGGAETGEGPIQDLHHPTHSENQAEHSKHLKAKLLLPFTRLIANINHALGLDAPNSTLKINHISLSSKQPSGEASQDERPIDGNKVDSSQETLHEGSTERAASHHPIAVDVPESNGISGVGEALKNVAEHHQDTKVDKPERPEIHHVNNGDVLSVQEHQPAPERMGTQASTSDIHRLNGGEKVEQNGQTFIEPENKPQGIQGGHLLHVSDEHSIKPPLDVQHNTGEHLMSSQEGRLHATPPLQKQLESPSGSVTHMVDESHSAAAPHVQEINDTPTVEDTHPGSCKDDGERCSLWQKRGHCRSVLYASFMKRHCKSTCGYCALPSIVIQSERANAGIRFAYGEHTCQDSSNYEFSCPTWKAQGYCQKKEQEMRRFCSSTCNFCKRKKVEKKKETKDETKHDQSGNTSGQPQSYAHAQTGQGNGVANAQAVNSAGQQQQQPNYAHAQVGKAYEPQSTAYATGGNTYVQTQSSGGQQTGYAVASAAASPDQQTYAQAQSSSQSGKPSTAYAQSQPSSNSKSSQSTAHAQTGSSAKPESVAHAQTAPVNDDPNQSSESKNRGEGKVADTSSASLNGISIDERVMSESPEYKTSSTDYYIRAGNPDETAASEANFYDEPPRIRFSTKNPEKSTKGYAGTQENFESGSEKNPEFEQGSSDDAETKAEYSKDDVRDMEVKATEDEKIQMLMNKFDPVMADEEDGDLAKSKIATKTPDKKGTLGSVSTKGCDQACQKECLDVINSYRRNHDVSPLILDQDLANHAQEWADSKTYGHSPWAQRGMGGELIAVGSFYKTFTAAVKAWHDEEKDFDWEKRELKKGKEIKHFKQLISKNAHVLGCGKSMVNGEPYYIARMDAAENTDDEKRETMERPAKPDLDWYMESSPYWKDLQTRERIPKNVHRNLL